MELHQLQILRELGELGSVKAVAETLSVTPSAVSQQISLLQRQVDTPLTRKEGRNLVLTAAGRVLADAGTEVINAMAGAKAAIGAYQHDSGGTVTISGFHSAGQALFAPLVRRLATLRASMDATIGVGASGDGASGTDAAGTDAAGTDAAGDGALGDGARTVGSQAGVPHVRFSDEDVAQHDFPALTARYDLVLAHRMDHSPAWPDTRVRVIPLAHEPLDIAVAPSHPLAAKDSLSPEDVVAYPWVTSRSGYSPADVLTAIGAVASRPVEVLHRINDYSSAAALVSTGEVIGLLPRYTSSPALASGRALASSPALASGRTLASGGMLPLGVVLRPLTGISTRRRIDLLARPENLRRASVMLVAQALQDVMAELTGE
ncbi:LysR family transcriptional regulator [Arthrobacter antibioticus]|uniref:LysR family transcriptional regulator n=1 Tax=Arthrobacter sp. H35-MC1 TaxID=3046203 RepID=UPI0024B9525B|nr:LysR family transcriptional regulator [Arthrobacter sp. H35-MC1]MDJ0317074.1 LysR family transcriptional regulator [Arthrobacter sp. H35-MC1]